MDKRTLLNKIKRFVRLIYLKLFRINDSPLKVALGFGLGVFVGVMPGMGPIMALLLAFLFRVNRASALLGSILFNTWFSLMALVFAIKMGSMATGLSYDDLYRGWEGLIKNFQWEKLFEASVYNILIPIGTGYLIISLIFASLGTVAVYLITQQIKRKTNEHT